MLKIKKFSLIDLNDLIKIEKISFNRNIIYSKQHIKKLAKKYPDGFYTAFLSKKLVGYVIGYINNNRGLIDSVAVTPNYRRQRIGTKITKFLLKRFKKNGVKLTSLHIRTDNKIGIVFYRKIGFKAIKTLKKYYKDKTDSLLMQKQI